MKAADVMTRAVVTIAPSAPILDAIRLMLGQRISGLPVVDDGKLVGILSEGDLLRRAELGTERHRPRWLGFWRSSAQQAGDYVQAHARRVEAVMTRQVASAGEDTSLDEIAALMESKRVKRVPIVTDDRLVGVISRADLLRALAKVLEEDEPVAPGDAALRERVTAEMRRQPWGGRSQVTVLVTDGIVYLEGHVFDLREREAMRVVAENVAGTTSVRDHLDYVDPTLGMMYGA